MKCVYNLVKLIVAFRKKLRALHLYLSLFLSPLYELIHIKYLALNNFKLVVIPLFIYTQYTI
jgi:hypothetical protein